MVVAMLTNEVKTLILNDALSSKPTASHRMLE